MIPRSFKYFAVGFVFLLGCSPYSVRTHTSPPTAIPDTFKQTSTTGKAYSLWWEEFNDEDLNRLIEIALQDNLSLESAWGRLEQAEARATIAGSERFPQISTGGQASRTRLVDPEIQGAINAEQIGTTYFNQFAVQNGLSYELDLWKRIASKSTAETLKARASRADVENTALLLTGTVADLWFRAQEQKALLNLLQKQAQVSETLLELTELRFSLGRDSALSVYQQRQQLAATRSQIPDAKSQLEQTVNQISTLVGLPPGEMHGIVPEGTLLELPPFPELVTPISLLETRPDLRQAKLVLQSGEYDIAAAVADRFPRLSIGLSYNFSASEVSDLFDRERGSMLGDILLPLVDGGRRRARVRETEGVVKERLARFGELYLTALSDVENALIAERYQIELLERLSIQERYARATLRESRSRYTNGLNDYLDVIIAIQALQELERRVILEKTELLFARSRLYRALGGSWTHTIGEEGLMHVKSGPLNNQTQKGSTS